MNTIALNRVHYPVTTLGPGVRLGLWVQGCTLACPGCVSQDTWDAEGAARRDVDLVLDEVRRLVVDDRLDGVTISGGEPFQQPAALTELVLGLRSWLDEAGDDGDLLCYTGYSFEEANHRAPGVVGAIDALISEPYRRGAGPGDAWRGSANQPLTLLTDRARRRYPVGSGKQTAADEQRRMQVSVEDGQIWLIGIPGPGDLQRVERRLVDNGVALGEVSWRP